MTNTITTPEHSRLTELFLLLCTLSRSMPLTLRHRNMGFKIITIGYSQKCTSGSFYNILQYSSEVWKFLVWAHCGKGAAFTRKYHIKFGRENNDFLTRLRFYSLLDCSDNAPHLGAENTRRQWGVLIGLRALNCFPGKSGCLIKGAVQRCGCTSPCRLWCRCRQ